MNYKFSKHVTCFSVQSQIYSVKIRGYIFIAFSFSILKKDKKRMAQYDLIPEIQSFLYCINYFPASAKVAHRESEFDQGCRQLSIVQNFIRKFGVSNELLNDRNSSVS